MKREELDAIRERVDYVINTEWQSSIVTDLIEDDVPALLAEVERLRNALFTIYEDASDDVTISICEEVLWNGEV